MFALTECRIFTGEYWLDDHALIIDGAHISAITPRSALPPELPCYTQGGALLTAGFIDLQLNGCGGVMFNSDISIATLESMQRTNLASGTTSFLPTLITATDADIRQAVAVTQAYMAQHKHHVLGLHLEGPYTNLERKGIHPAPLIRALDPAMLDFLCQHGNVIAKVTLAPECHPSHHIQALANADILVAMGHTAANYNEAMQGIAAGVGFATHLYNAMTPTSNGRMPGVVGAVYDSPNIYAGIIADGIHVHDANVRLAHKILGPRLCLVTDATAAAGAPAELEYFDFCGTKVWIRDGQCVDEQGTLGGSSLTMIAGVRHLIAMGIKAEEALRMASLYPARAIGQDHHLGSIAPGKVANLAVLTGELNDTLSVKATLVNGQFHSGIRS
ncbi:N-acetylglucosamine-6-phosphate deacetylase [Oceanisphaera pacifica]|uniref:N-acetylglucosamine-6-phosphate deacetylase n=1 Tax=Oceanisphaera pacifica TaxID=2818389 RepID=A0ABS3NE49_9GAMM|nr:N-acetylglucosamine-6-phosphate deacetylase [Oceanisphaera pacifica]